jgi:heat shock protein HslJ
LTGAGRAGAAGAFALVLAACAPAAAPRLSESQRLPASALAPPPDDAVLSLEGSGWRLLSFQSSDDAVGVLKPSRPDEVAMYFGEDGRAIFRLDCNRGTGPFTAEAGAGATSGTLRFGAVAVTARACADSGLADRLAKDLEQVRGYLLKGDRLYLSLMADGGTYAFEPAPPE